MMRWRAKSKFAIYSEVRRHNHPNRYHRKVANRSRLYLASYALDTLYSYLWKGLLLGKGLYINNSKSTAISVVIIIQSIDQIKSLIDLPFNSFCLSCLVMSRSLRTLGTCLLSTYAWTHVGSQNMYCTGPLLTSQVAPGESHHLQIFLAFIYK